MKIGLQGQLRLNIVDPWFIEKGLKKPLMSKYLPVPNLREIFTSCQAPTFKVSP
jgi:hypothetical protein